MMICNCGKTYPKTTPGIHYMEYWQTANCCLCGEKCLLCSFECNAQCKSCQRNVKIKKILNGVC